MSRWALVAALMLVATVCLQADADDPASFRIVSSWNGHVLPSSNGLFLHRAKPAWTSSEPALERLDRRGKRLHAALPGYDLRAAVAWRDRIIAVRLQPRGYDILVLDSTLTILSQIGLEHTQHPGREVVVEAVTDDRINHVYLRLDSLLLRVSPLQQPLRASVIDTRVSGLQAGTTKRGEAAYVHDVGGAAFLSVLDSSSQRRATVPVPIAPASRIVLLDELVAVISSIDEARQTQVTFVDPATGRSRTTTIQTSAELVDVAGSQSGPVLAALLQRDGRYELVHAGTDDMGIDLLPGVRITGDLGVPVRVRIADESTFVVLQGGLVSAEHEGTIVSRDPFPVQLDPTTLDVFTAGGYTFLSSLNGTLRLVETSHPAWWIVRAARTVGAYVVPIILVIVILVLWTRLRRQQRYLNTMLEVPGAGLVLVLDANGRLIRTNERAAQLLRISNRVPMGRSVESYVRHHGVEGLRAFLVQAYAEQRPLSEKVSVDDGDENREYVATARPIFGTLGRLRGIVFTAIDITEALERRRLVNWAQLAHDMQTNLSTIRLNAEQLVRETADTNNERLRRILFQTRVLTQRVRDLVGVGRSEEIVRAPVHSAEFCTQIRHEFDPDMFPHVTFSMKLRGAMMNVDRLKLSRAVRNAVENAIKALRSQPGTVEIATWADRENVYIRVSDTGVGMDTLTLENMMKPYYTTAKDGSGTGIGTMIMQHVTNQHGGSLRVTSEPGEGTQVVFRIPHQMQGARHTPVDADELMPV